MKTARLIWNIVTWTIVILAVAVAILLAGVRLFGIHPYTVLSGSMEPTYHVGSIVYVVDVDKHELKVNDPVTYKISDSVVVTHRIIEIVPAVDENGAPVINEKTGKQAIRFVTKGDANNSADGSQLHENNVIGKPIFTIPYLGYVADYIQNPPGTYIAIVVACLLLATLLPDILFPDDKKEKEKAAQVVSAEQMNAAQQEIEEIKSQLAATEQNAPPTEDAAAAEADAPAETADNGGDNTAE